MSASARLRALRGVPQRYRTDRRLFESLVAEALDGLPAAFQERLSNVAVVVEEWPPDDDELETVDVAEDTDLLGLYQGIPLGQRSTGYNLVMPDRITIYRQPILAQCRSEADLRREVRETVEHEIGHHFGLSDAELP
jgi:predicted Zn-dependent protease with MMP-like domain